MLIFSAEELDALMAAHPDRVVVLEASFTWCRPCKGFQRPYEARRPSRGTPPWSRIRTHVQAGPVVLCCRLRWPLRWPLHWHLTPLSRASSPRFVLRRPAREDGHVRNGRCPQRFAEAYPETIFLKVSPPWVTKPKSVCVAALPPCVGPEPEVREAPFTASCLTSDCDIVPRSFSAIATRTQRWGRPEPMSRRTRALVPVVRVVVHSCVCVDAVVADWVLG